MVKEKKLTKSSIAIIVLALLLVASLIMGMTGAWFTAQKTPTDGGRVLDFGTVALSSETNALSITTTADVNSKVADKDQFNLAAASVTNNSDVAIYYIYTYEFDLYDSTGTNLIAANARWDKKTYISEGTAQENEILNANPDTTTKEHIRASFTGLLPKVAHIGFKTAAQGTDALVTEALKTVTFDSDGNANGHDVDYKLVAKLSVKTVQARHIADATELAGLLGVGTEYAANSTAYEQSIKSQIDAAWLAGGASVELAA